MQINGRNIEFKSIKRIWSIDYKNSDNRNCTCYHHNKKVLTEHIEFLKSRKCYDFKEFKHNFCLLDQDGYIYDIPQSEVSHYKELLSMELTNK